MSLNIKSTMEKVKVSISFSFRDHIPIRHIHGRSSVANVITRVAELKWSWPRNAARHNPDKAHLAWYLENYKLVNDYLEEHKKVDVIILNVPQGRTSTTTIKGGLHSTVDKND